MARNPALGSFPKRIRRHEEEIRQLRLGRGPTETKTFIVGGPIDTDVYVPPFFVGGFAYKLIGFRALLEAGSCELSWLLNGDVVASGQSATTDPTASIVNIEAVNLLLGDVIQVEITAATGASNLSAAAFMVTSG